MAELELEKPLFRRTRTQSLIDAIAHTSSLVVYAGAGVTADQTGLTWKELVVRLLEERGISRTSASTLVDTYGAVNTGSIISELYLDDGDEEALENFANRVRALIYTKLFMFGGRTAQSVAELAAELVAAQRRVEILTTNYDESLTNHIDRAFRAWTARLPDMTTMKQVDVQYLHGRLPRNGIIDDFPVISEQDYLARSHKTSETITAALSENACLIVGSGLNDRPLLDALIRTREEADSKGLLRLALIPRSDVGADSPDGESDSRLQLYINRLEHLGLQAIFVDYYSQVAQFVTEVRLASTIQPGDYARDNTVLHQSRLEKWQQTWNTKCAEPIEDLQATHHAKLKEYLASFRSKLKDVSENLKVDLWIRTKTGLVDERRFQLWASSYAQYPYPDLARAASIVTDTDHAAVRAFRSGRVVTGKGLSDRWLTYAALPLVPPLTVNATVGVIVIASMTPNATSVLSEGNLMRHHKALLALQSSCLDLLSV